MIQRIQTLYLLVVSILAGVMFFTPLMRYGTDGEQVWLHALKLMHNGESIGSTPLYFPILLSLAALLPLVIIFLFKRRMLQIRLCAAEAVLLLGVACMEAMLFWGPKYESGSLTPASFAPIAALLFVWLAARAIFKDELLVKSLDRIR